MPVNLSETRHPAARGLQYSLRDLFLYFLAITLLISGYTTACSRTVSENASSYIRYVLPVLVGCFLYLIGTLIRRHMHYSRIPPVTRFMLILILLISGTSICYLLWAYERVYFGEYLFSGPHEWPYPDKALLKLDTWLNLHYPVGPTQTIFDNNGVPIYTGPIELKKLEGKSVLVLTAPPMKELFRRILFALEILIGPFIVIVAGCLGLLVPFRLEWLDKLKSICKRCLRPNR
jgi:hypothetical protein